MITTRPIHNNGCMRCGVSIPADQKISHRGQIVCGDCFLLMTNPIEALAETIETPVIELNPDDPDTLLTQVMEMMVEFDKRLTSLEDAFNRLETQFESICA